MKCTCTRADLRDALNAVARAVAIKPSTPVIAGIFLHAEGNTLELQATNFQLSIVAKIPASIESEGDTVVLGKVLPEIVNKLSGEVVTISTAEADDENKMGAVLKSEAATFELLTMDATEFPQINPDAAEKSFRIQAIALKNLIARTVFACAFEDSRPVLTGCNVEIHGADIKFVATNTHRVAITSDKIFDEIDELRFVVPANSLRNLLSMLVGVHENIVAVDFSGASAAFTFDNIFMSTRLIDGEFPAYERVIPKSSTTNATVETAELLKAIDRMQIIARETEYKTVTMNFTQDGLEISSTSNDVGKSMEHVDAEVEGDDLKISFNFNYIVDVLKIVSSKKIRFAMNQPLQAVEIRGLSEDNFIYIVTPLRA